jgi:hypothetical protein
MARTLTATPLPAGPLPIRWRRSEQNAAMSGGPGRRRLPDPLWRPPPGSVILGFTSTDEPIYITEDVRRLGAEIIGLPGQGKSRLGEGMLRQDYLSRVSVGALLIDPHGPFSASFLNWTTTHGLTGLRPIRVLNASDPRRVFHLNPLRRRSGVDPAVVASAVVNAILRAWRGAPATATPQLRETLKNAMVALVELGLPITEAGNLLDLTDATGLRAYAIAHVSNPIVRQFLQTLDALRIADRDAKVGSAIRRLNEFLLPERVRLIFSNPEHAIDWRTVMDAGEFVIVDLSYAEGKLSEDEAQLIGTMMLAEVFLSCLGRPEDSTPFYVYVDECHRFLTEDVAKFFTEGRKFNCSAVLLHQTLAQLQGAGAAIFSAVMAARTRIACGSTDDALYLAQDMFRGQFDLQTPKERYNKPVVVSQVPDWLMSVSQSLGGSHADGTIWSRGGGVAVSHSATQSIGSAISEGTSASATIGTSSGSERTMESLGSTESATSTATEGTSETDAVTESANSSEGGSETRTESWQQTQGRSQTLRSVFEVLPTTPYSLAELEYMGAVRIAELKPGEAIVKIGTAPPAQIQAVRVKDGWARPEHVARITERLAVQTPYIASLEEAVANQQRRRRELIARIATPSAEVILKANDDEVPLVSPPLKDEGWG